MPTPNDPLDPLLDRWKASPEPDRDLAREVWRRIELAEGVGRRTGFWDELDALFSRPPFAAMFVACCALLGLFFAEVRVNRVQRAQSAELARSYVQLIDPLLGTAEEPKQP